MYVSGSRIFLSHYLTGMPTQTATGTIAVHVEDTNDNCPTLTSHVQYLCSDTKVRVQ